MQVGTALECLDWNSLRVRRPRGECTIAFKSCHPSLVSPSGCCLKSAFSRRAVEQITAQSRIKGDFAILFIPRGVSLPSSSRHPARNTLAYWAQKESSFTAFVNYVKSYLSQDRKTMIETSVHMIRALSVEHYSFEFPLSLPHNHVSAIANVTSPAGNSSPIIIAAIFRSRYVMEMG